MNADQKKAALAHVNKYVTTKPCPCCGSRDFIIDENLGLQSKMDENKNITPTEGHASLVVVCKSCAYTLLFNAVRLGLA